MPCSDDATRQEDIIRDHGGDIDTAQARFGGTDWIDLSTGINRAPYPLPSLPQDVWTALPTLAATSRLLTAAGAAYQSQAPILAVAGAQSAIQLIPRLSAPARACILTPTYNEHAAALGSTGAAGRDLEDQDHQQAGQRRAQQPVDIVLLRALHLAPIERGRAQPVHPAEAARCGHRRTAFQGRSL